MAKSAKTLQVGCVAACGMWASSHCDAAAPAMATSSPHTQEHVILEAGGIEAAAIAKAFPGRLRKVPEAPAAFRLNNVIIAPGTTTALDTSAPPERGTDPETFLAEPPGDPPQVAALEFGTAQDTQRGALVAAAPPAAATGDSLSCGEHTARTLTVCLNEQRKLDSLDRIAVLAFTQEASVAYVDGEAERAALDELLAGLPHQLEATEFQVATDPANPSARTGRIHLVRKP